MDNSSSYIYNIPFKNISYKYFLYKFIFTKKLFTLLGHRSKLADFTFGKTLEVLHTFFFLKFKRNE